MNKKDRKEMDEKFETHRQIMYGLIRSLRDDFKHEIQNIKRELRLTGTAGKPPPDLPPTCPYCNRRLRKDSNGHYVCVVCPYPREPLHARVAKALGVRPYKNANGWFYGGGHMLDDYPNDLVAAMGALEEYCREHGCFLNIYGGSNREWEIQIFDKDTHRAKVSKSSPSFSYAISLAIVAHSEGK